jgi:shikimate dehydrogenase
MTRSAACQSIPASAGLRPRLFRGMVNAFTDWIARRETSLMAARNFKQEIVALFGQPVAENPTQAMIEAGFASLDLDWRYLTLEVAPDDLENAVKGARAMGLRGFHCTIPHKVEVVPHLDRLGQSAAVIGAVNCVVARGGELVGENTDGKGFLMALPRDPAGANVVVLGAGGAARAICVELALAGAAHMTVVNRDAGRGTALRDLLNAQFPAVPPARPYAVFEPWQGDFAVPSNTDIVVNATSIGLYPDTEARIPLEEETLLPRMLVADVVPNPPETRLVRTARHRGAEAIDGLGTLVMQGVIAVEHWTGIRPQIGAMRNALELIFRS